MKKIRTFYFLKDIPDKENEYAFINNIKRFSDLYVFYTESLFLKQSSLEKLKKKSDKVFNLRNFTHPNIVNLAGRMNILFFQNMYLFKHYFYLFKELISYSSLLVLDIRDSVFLKFLSKYLSKDDPFYRNQLSIKIEVLKEKYLYILHYFDIGIVNSEKEKEYLSKEFHKTAFMTEKEFLKKLKEKNFKSFKFKKKQLKSIFTDLFEFRPVNEFRFYDVDVFRITAQDLNVENYNRIFRNARKKYLLIYDEEDFFADGFVEFFKFVMIFNERNAMVIPSHISNRNLSSKNYNLLVNFYKKHFLVNLGNWRKLKTLFHFCFFLKTDIFEKIGLLDERFKTLSYALLDYGYRIYQKDLNIFEISEILVTDKKALIENQKDKNAFVEDREFLIKKWSNLLPLNIYEY